MIKKKKLSTKAGLRYALYVLDNLEFTGRDINEVYRQDRDNVMDINDGETETINKIDMNGYITCRTYL